MCGFEQILWDFIVCYVFTPFCLQSSSIRNWNQSLLDSFTLDGNNPCISSAYIVWSVSIYVQLCSADNDERFSENHMQHFIVAKAKGKWYEAFTCSFVADYSDYGFVSFLWFRVHSCQYKQHSHFLCISIPSNPFRYVIQIQPMLYCMLA